MKVELTSISSKDKNVLGEMLREYQRELLGKEPGEYKYLDSYWNEPNRFPFFILVDDEIVGFVLINSHSVISVNAKSIAEFYIKKEFRKKGIGNEAAKQAFELFPGRWETRQLKGKAIVHSFWLEIISELTHNQFQEIIMNNKKWKGWVQTFNLTGNNKRKK